MKQRNKGFTLIELMIVIAIIGILMAYAIPAYKTYTTRTLLNEGNNMSSSYKLAISLAYAKGVPLTSINNGVFGVANASARGECVKDVTVTGVAAEVAIVVTYDCAAGTKGQAYPDVDSATLTWKATSPAATNTGTLLVWECVFNPSAVAYNPCPNA